MQHLKQMILALDKRFRTLSHAGGGTELSYPKCVAHNNVEPSAESLACCPLNVSTQPKQSIAFPVRPPMAPKIAALLSRLDVKNKEVVGCRKVWLHHQVSSKHLFSV